MAKELNEDSGFKVSIKTLIAIGFAMATVISMWFMLQADINEARELPEPPPQDVTRMEFDMKDQMIRNTIIYTVKILHVTISSFICHIVYLLSSLEFL